MMAFDLLHLDGRNLSTPALHVRKPVLEKLLGRSNLPHGLLRYSAHMTGDGGEIRVQACSMQY